MERRGCSFSFFFDILLVTLEVSICVLSQKLFSQRLPFLLCFWNVVIRKPAITKSVKRQACTVSYFLRDKFRLFNFKNVLLASSKLVIPLTPTFRLLASRTPSTAPSIENPWVRSDVLLRTVPFFHDDCSSNGYFV